MPHYNTAFTIDAGSRHHATRRAEPLWRSWCKSPIWKSIRRHRLAEEPQCRQCAIEGRPVVASHVDHITPHLGQWLLFFKYENTQSLCAHHHSMHKQQEKRGNTTHPPAEQLDGAGPRASWVQLSSWEPNGKWMESSRRPQVSWLQSRRHCDALLSGRVASRQTLQSPLAQFVLRSDARIC